MVTILKDLKNSPPKMRIDKYLSSYNVPVLTIDSHFVMKL